MTVAEAARVFEENKRLEASARAKKEAAQDVLKAWFERTGKQDYRGIIGYAKSSYRAVDVARLRAEHPELAEELTEVRVRTTLSLLR